MAAVEKDAAPAGVADDGRGATSEGSRAVAARVSLQDVALPVETLNAALPHFRRPFSSAAIKFKVQNVWPKNDEPKGCIVVSYIDARLVVERLNAVAGYAWTPSYRPLSKDNLLACDLAVFNVVRTDVGESTKGLSKDLISDALKRSAVHFGIGVSVYALPQITLYANQPHVERREVWDAKAKAKKPTLVLTDLGHTKLREGYERWLAETGEPSFGPVLDHGDVVGTIDPDAEAALEGADEFVPAAPPALEDDEAKDLTNRARVLYARIVASGAQHAFPPAQFDAWLRQSAHSHEALRQLLEHVQKRHDELVG